MKKKVGKIIENVIYILLLVPLIIITVRISYQAIFFKDKIPDIFGYKFFVILDGNMESSLEYGDLAIIYDENIDKIKENDVIAFRNGNNTVTIHKVDEIHENYDINSNTNKKIFIMNNVEIEEIDDNKISKEKIEGVEVNRIQKLGLIMYQISKPKTIIVISCIILAIGSVWIYIARALDKKETMRLEQEEIEKQKNEVNTETQKKEQKDSIEV